MQDRLKFRAWDKEKDILWYGIENCYNDWDCQNFYDYVAKDRYIVEQCLGLKDKNDKLIYEGDIVIEKDLYKRKTLVKWLDNKCGFNVSTTFGYDDGKCSFAGNVEYEVIGNIHENPDLLENKDE